MAFLWIVLEFIVLKECVWCQSDKVYRSCCRHEIDVPIDQCQNILFNFGDSRITFLILNLLDRQYFIYWLNNVAENIVSTDDVRKCFFTIDYHKLVGALVIPKHIVDSVGNQLNNT